MIKCKKMNRRGILFLTGVILLLLLAKGVYAFSTVPERVRVEEVKPTGRFDAPLTQSDWPMFHNDTARLGYSEEKYIAPPLQVRWGFSTGSNIWSSPAVVADVLFVGSSDGKLYSIDVVDGTMRWAFRTGNAIFSSPCVDKGTVYFGSSDHLFYAVDAETGALKWTFETEEPVTSSPCVDNDLIYFGSWDGNLYVLDKAGSLKWKFKTNGAIYSSPTIARGKVFIGSSDGRMYAIDKLKGIQAWSYPTDDYVSATPAVAGKYLYFGSWDGNMYAVGADDGKLYWKFRTGGGIYSSATVMDENLYFGSYDGKLYCLEKNKGFLKWSYTAKDSVYHSSPVVANNIVYIGLGYKNKVQAFNARTGEYIWSYPTGASVGASCAISGTNMYIAASDGKIYAFGDIAQPEARVSPLKPAYNLNMLFVSWKGEDQGGSGIRSYDVQYRTGGGDPWTPWQTGVSTTFAEFGPSDPVVVRDNTVYYFQARARDNAGNIGNFAGGDGDTFTVIDTVPPRIAKVSINNQPVESGSFIQSKPLIQASISDNVAVDLDSLKVYIDGREYVPDSFINGLLKYKHKEPLMPGKHSIKVIAADIAGNKADPWQVLGVRVSEGIEAADISSYPTPFNPIAGPVYISYRLNAAAETNIYIYDKFGSLVYLMKFTEGQNGGKRGWNKIVWSGITGASTMVGNGDYSFKIVANRNLVGRGQIEVQK